MAATWDDATVTWDDAAVTWEGEGGGAVAVAEAPRDNDAVASRQMFERWQAEEEDEEEDLLALIQAMQRSAGEPSADEDDERVVRMIVDMHGRR